MFTLTTVPQPVISPATPQSEALLCTWIDAWADSPYSRHFGDFARTNQTFLIIGSNCLRVLRQPAAIEYAWGTYEETGIPDSVFFTLNPEHIVYRRMLEGAA